MENKNLEHRDFVPPPSTDFNVPRANRFEKEISPLKKNVAILLAFFLGTYGAHLFYMGYTKKGIIRIVLFLLIITSPIASFLGFIDFLKLIFQNEYLDGQGRVLQ